MNHLATIQNGESVKGWKRYPTYKDSGVAWLGEIPEHWETQKLKHLGEVKLSNVDKKSKENEDTVKLCNYVDVYYNDYITERIQFLVATASLDQKRKFALRKGDVLLTKDSETWDDIAIPAYVETNLGGVICGYHLAHIRPYEAKAFGEYLFRAISSTRLREQFWVAANGVTRFGISKSSISDVLLPAPLLPEQHLIAQFLNRETAKIDTLIAKKERLIDLLKEKRTALISHAVTKGLNPDVPMKDSGIPSVGQIPEHWNVERNKLIFREIDKRSKTGKEELLTVSHITGITPRSEKEVNMFLAESMEGYKLCSPDDLIINTMWAWMGALGISSYAGIVSPSYNVYRLNREYIPKYLDLLYRTPAYICEITRYSKGVWTSRLRLYPDEFFEIYTVTPPLSEQQQIVEYIEREQNKIQMLSEKLQGSIERLREYRTALISAAVTGKIDVRGEVVA